LTVLLPSAGAQLQALLVLMLPAYNTATIVVEATHILAMCQAMQFSRAMIQDMFRQSEYHASTQVAPLLFLCRMQLMQSTQATQAAAWISIPMILQRL
jgi:hypothetical protein